MDFDIIDDTRPRLQLQQSGGHFQDGDARSGNLSKVSIGICVFLGVLLIGLGLSSTAGAVQFVVIWLGISLALGPFAPPSITGGDCRVGVGELVLPDSPEKDAAEQMGGKGHNSHSKDKSLFRKPPTVVVNGDVAAGRLLPAEHEHHGNDGKHGTKSFGESDVVKSSSGEREQDWNSEDIELLKKLIVKHPRGTLKRWEIIAEAFGGRHSADGVVKMSKALGQRKVGGGDQGDYSRFLAQRRGAEIAIASELSRREESDLAGEGSENVGSTELSDEATAGSSKETWTPGEDRALATALKAFPKDSPMRWEKVALAVPGKSKAQCLRRFSEIRKSVRSAIGTGVSSSRGENANS